MRRGTTPTHNFVLPFEVEKVAEVEIIYQQNDKTLLTKHIEHCTLKDSTISVTLTQEETFCFKEGVHVCIQVRVLTDDGTALASDVLCVCCDKCLSDEVL